MDCRRCQETLDRLKTADWDKHEAEKKYSDLADHNTRILMWLKDRRIRLPDSGELERRFPLEHRKDLRVRTP